MCSTVDFEQAAENIFCRSLNAFLAKSISALVSKANEKDIFVDLSVRIMKVPFNRKFPCALSCIFKHPTENKKGYFWAYIYIHPKCTKKLAKFAVAHELGHLFQELESLKEHKKTHCNSTEGWKPTYGYPPEPIRDAMLEAQCNLFATRLSSYHHHLNCNFGLRKKFKLFPSHIVGQPAHGNIKNVFSLDPEFKVGDSTTPDFDTIYTIDEIYSFADTLHCISPCSSTLSEEKRIYCNDCSTSSTCIHKNYTCPPRDGQLTCTKCPENQLCQFYNFISPTKKKY